MSAEGAADPALLDRIAELVRQVAGEDGQWPGRIGPHTRLEGDLYLLCNEADLARLDAQLRADFGGQADLAGHLAGLDLDELVALSVADVAAFVARRCAPVRSGAR